MKWAFLAALMLVPLLHSGNRIVDCCWWPSSLAAAAQTAAAPPASGTEAMYQAAASSAQQKINHLRQNAARPRPDPAPTVLTEREWNAYLASGEAKLPRGVQSLRLAGEPGIVKARARVNFDAITAEARSPNPLLALFSGVHDVEAAAHAGGSAGQAQVRLDSVAIDGVAVPRMVLELFARTYLKPRYPNLGLDSTFPMPERIDQATLGRHDIALTQK